MRRGTDYETAHDRASRVEQQFRKDHPNGGIEEAQTAVIDLAAGDAAPEATRINAMGQDVRDVVASLRIGKPLELMTAAELSKRARDLEIERDNRVMFEVDTVRLDAALAVLVRAGVTTLTCQPPTLEELFLRHYGDRIDSEEQEP